MRFSAILFDFDGVLIESESAGNAQIAEFLTGAGHPICTREAMDQFMGLAGPDLHAAIEGWVGGPIPAGFHEARRAADEAMARDGIAEVAGATCFVHSLDPAWPRAVVSSSSKRWISTHLAHLGLAAAFGEHLYSGRENVARGKPAPDLYLYAADKLGVHIDRCVIIEDSPVGATGAVASGATVIGLLAAGHIGDGHGERLRAIGVQHLAAGFDEVARLIA